MREPESGRTILIAFTHPGTVAEVGLFSGILCGVVFLWLVLWFFIALWVHGNAPRYGRNPLVWFLVVFLLGFIGLIAYFALRGAGRGMGRRDPKRRKRARSGGRKKAKN